MAWKWNQKSASIVPPSKNYLFLGSYETYTPGEIKADILSSYRPEEADLDKYQIILAYLSDEDYSATADLVLFNLEDGCYYENYASHCSCDGFEGQFKPTKISETYLLSPQFLKQSYLFDRPEVSEFLTEFFKKN